MLRTLSRPLLHEVMEKAARNLVPFQVTLELTYRCNLSCKHCYVDLPSTDVLSLSELKDILDQLARAGTLYLLLTGGEILTRADFFDIARYAQERGFLLMLLTNGTLITPSISRDIASLKPLLVGLSLYGATPHTHDEITGRRGSFASLLGAVELLKSAGVRVVLQSLLMDSNVQETAAIRSLAANMGVPLRLGYELIPTKSCDRFPQRYETDLDHLGKFVQNPWIGLGSDIPDETVGICKAGRGICSISPTGDVFPCAAMPLLMGNLRRSPFSDIWSFNPSEEVEHLRSLTERDITRCIGCNLRRYCQRCIGVALSETGHLAAPAPSACRYAAMRRDLLISKGDRT